MQDQFVRRFMLKKTSESTKELDEEGGYYTPDEMKKLLNYPQWLECKTQEAFTQSLIK